MTKRIEANRYELLGVRGIKRSNGKSAQIATRRMGYSTDRLYAWSGRHDNPSWEQEQGPLETEREFIASL